MNGRFGMNIGSPTNAACVSDCAALGVGWVRFEINWPDVEPARKGVWNWKPFDDSIKLLRAAGLNILGSLSYAPGWASGDKTTKKAPPRRAADYKDYVTQVVRRYRGSIQHWSIWNEPNLKQFFTGTRNEYIDRVLLPGVEGIRGADSGAKLVGPDLSYKDGPRKSEYWYAWLKAILTARLDAFDIMSIHIYKEPKTFELWRHLEGQKIPLAEGPNVKDAFRTFVGDGKPVWITEIGWESKKSEEAKQRQFYEQFLNGMNRSRTWIERVFLYNLRDGSEETFGLMRTDGTPKQAYALVRTKLAAMAAGDVKVTAAGTSAAGKSKRASRATSTTASKIASRKRSARRSRRVGS